MTNSRPHPVVMASKPEEINAAMAMPTKLIDPETGREFHMRQWQPSISVKSCVTVAAEFVVYMPAKSPAECTCHERDSSYVCESCYSKGRRGHMQK